MTWTCRMTQKGEGDNEAVVEFPMVSWITHPILCFNAWRMVRALANLSEEEMLEWVSKEIEEGRAKGATLTNRETGEVVRY